MESTSDHEGERLGTRKRRQSLWKSTKGMTEGDALEEEDILFGIGW